MLITSHTYIFGGALPPFLESWGALAHLAPPSTATESVHFVKLNIQLIINQPLNLR